MRGDFDNFIMSMMRGAGGESGPVSRSEAIDMLDKYQSAQKNDIQAGDMVQRNSLGRARYKHPDESANHVARCLKKLDTPMIDEAGLPCDMLMVSTVGKDVVVQYLVDSAFYEKAAEKKNIVNLFRKKD